MSSIKYKEALIRSLKTSDQSILESIPEHTDCKESKEMLELTASLEKVKISNGKPCGFCKREIHIPKNCPDFKKFKDRCTTKSFAYTYPTKRDLNGYCSAAVLLFGKYENEIYVMMVLENRDDIPALNFPGGKREYRNEKPRQCAIREMLEELIDCPKEVFDTESYKIVKSLYLWYAQAKYFVIPVEYTFTSAPIINEKFKWVNIKNFGIETLYRLSKQVISTFKLDNPEHQAY